MAEGPYRKAGVAIEPPDYVITTNLVCMEYDGLGGKGWPSQIIPLKPAYSGRWKLIDTYVEPDLTHPSYKKVFFWTWKRLKDR